MSLFNNFNKVVVMGNMTRDIELRTIPSGTRVADITVAVNDRVKKGEEWVDESTFVDITVWGKTAEFVERFGGKGKSVLIEGRLKQDKWVDKQSGQNRTKLKVVAENVVFCGGKDGGGGGPGRSSSARSSGGKRDDNNDYGQPPADEMPYAQSMEEPGSSETPPF